MPGPEAGAPVVGLPERVDRRVRLGPFPCATDALKFVCYAAAGAVLAPFASPWAWLPVVAAGFAVSVWRPDGDALDERAVRWVRFQCHRWRAGVLMAPRSLPSIRGPVARLSSGAWVTVVRCEGTPLAYRPPAELAVLFDQFRELLRATEGPLVLRSMAVPLADGAVSPRRAAPSEGEETARGGYAELVTVLCRRRRSRRVEIALFANTDGPEGPRRLAERSRSLAESLHGFGVKARVVADRPLAEAVRGFAWNPVGGSP